MREPRPTRAIPADPRRVAPPHIEGVPLDRLPVREPIQTLQHHHRGHHRRRHRRPAPLAEQIIEQLVGEQPVPFPRQEPLDRVPRQRALAKLDHITKQITLTIRPTQRHLIILPHQNPRPGDRHAKNTSHLALFQPLLGAEGVEARQHQTVLYNSIFRSDDEMLINPQVYGIAAAYAPVLYLRRVESGGVFDIYADSFERVWAEAMPLNAPAPV
jgi:hypothetical protein